MPPLRIAVIGFGSMGAADPDSAVGSQTSGAEQIAQATGACVVKASNTVPAEFIAAERARSPASMIGYRLVGAAAPMPSAGPASLDGRRSVA